MTTPQSSNKLIIHNFGAGPCVLPRPVLEEAQRGLLDFADTGLSILEVSHRSPPFQSLMDQTDAQVRQLLQVPDTHSVLFLQGGASTQFAAVWYNLMASRVIRDRFPHDQLPAVDYIITGSWSKKAAQEVRKLGGKVNIVVDASQHSHTHHSFRGIPPQNDWSFTGPGGRDAAYVYYCDNETVHGVEWNHVPQVSPDTVLVCDMSSNIMSRPVDVSRFGVILAGAQKNMGPAGVTLVIVRKDLLAHANGSVVYTPFPTMLDYQVADANASLYNTPPVFAIYVSHLFNQWMLDHGGVIAMEDLSRKKSGLLYNTIQESQIYQCPVAIPYRSRMNVVFTLTRSDLQAEFLREAEKRHMVQLKGHRSVGGIRASLYNALPVASVEALVAFMEEFELLHSTA
ncbi:Phosphoserine transaminase [Dispira simplex]|nr:Phosphoserine transaminase [Dispira simplex]